MARSGIGVLICGAALAVCCLATEPGKGPERNAEHKAAGDGSGGGERRPEMDEEEAKSFQKLLERVPAERREQFLKNFEAWIKLPNSERDFLRQREEARRKERRRQAEKAMKDAGIELEGDQKVKFLERFGQERRRIEEELRKEMEEKRSRLVQESLERLRSEFSQAAEKDPVSAPASGTSEAGSVR